MSETLDLRGLLAKVAQVDDRFVVIGSSALAMHGWEVAPGDLDLMTERAAVDAIVRAIDAPGDGGVWVTEGEARRFECHTSEGPVDLYTAVSGGLTFEAVIGGAVTINLGQSDLKVLVGSLEHIRDMRAAGGRSSLPSSAIPPTARPGAPRIVAIDGPAGAGKSTVSRGVAKKLGFTYLNSGAIYRCVALAVLRARADTDDHEAIEKIASGVAIEFRDERVLFNGEDVSEAIRTEDVTTMTSHIAAYPEVREAVWQRQRQLFAEGEYVAEGRDTGTVVAPDAPLKIFLTASIEERSRRRAEETGEAVDQVARALKGRDRLDSERRLSALRPAEDAVVLDTTELSVQDVVDEIAHLARERGIA